MELDSRVAKFLQFRDHAEIQMMLTMLIVRGIMTKVVLRMNKMPHIALNHVVTLWVVWLKKMHYCVFAKDKDIQKYK